MKTRVTWNLYSTALLLNAYETIKRNSSKRNQIILKLSQFLRGQIDKKKEIASDAYASTVDINQKLGKLECLMTDGERGLPGAVLPCMAQAVDLYKNDHELFILYKKAAQKKMTLSQLKKQMAKKEEQKEKAVHEVAAPETKVAEENLVEPEMVPVASVEKKFDEKESEPGAGPEAEFVIQESSSPVEPDTAENADEGLALGDLLPLDASVKELHLSGRLENLLCRNGIWTIKNMLDFPKDDWMSIHGMGAKSFKEMQFILEKYRSISKEFLPKVRSIPGTVPVSTKEGKTIGASISESDLVAALPISNRLKNTMHRNGIHTFGEMLAYPREKWLQMHGLGKGSLVELENFLDSHQEPNFNTIESYMDLESPVSYDTPIQRLDFGRKLNTVLQNAGFRTLRDVLRYPKERWYDLPGLRIARVEELLEKMESYRGMARATAAKQREMESQGESPERLAREAKSLAVFADTIGVTYEYIMGILHEMREEKCSTAEKLWAQEQVQAAVKAWTLKCLQNAKYDGLTLYELSRKIPVEVFDEEIFEELLKNMQECGQIRKKDEVFYRVYPPFAEYLASVNEKTRGLIELRLVGKTLEEAAQTVGLTRERVRQIQKKFLAQIPLIEEGYWISLQRKYKELTKEDFAFVFQLSSKTVMLLQLWCGDFATVRTGDKESRAHALHQIMNDLETDEVTYKRAQLRLQEISPYFNIDGKRIPRKRDALVRFTIKKYCQETRTLAELKDYYDKLRFTVGYEAATLSFDIDLRYLEHYLSSMNVLSSSHKRLRYYDILANDYGEFLDELDFSSYSNVTISTLKFFRDYPELMKQYDIRSEDELHNLLKKLWEHGHYNDYIDEEHKLTVERMPMITFGKADRAAQIVQLLRENNPISYMEFAKLIEDEYGIPQPTALSNWIAPVDKYLINGTYIMSECQLPPDHLERLKEILTEDYYLTAEIRNAYVNEYLDVNPWDIGKGAMHEMGFTSHGKYAVRNTYKNAGDFFEQLFAREDMVDVREKPEFTLSGMYYIVRQKFQEEYRMVEVEPGVFYNIRYLNALGVTEEDISNFCKEVYEFVSDRKCFTIQSLKQRGFVLPWADGSWSDWLYAALLSADKEHFNSQRLGSTKILRRRKMERKLTLSDLLEEITDEASYMLTPEEICQMLKFKYGIETTPFKIREIAQSDDMFDDRILY